MSNSTSPRLARASAVLAVSMLVASASNYLLNLVLARMLDQSSFGDASLMVTSMLALTSIAVAFQLVTVSQVAGADDAATVEARSRLMRQAGTVGLAVGGALWLGADLLQSHLQTGSAWPFRILGLGIPLYLGQAVDRGLVQARLGFVRLAASYLAEAAVRVVAGISLVWLGFGVAGTTWGLTLSFAASWAVVAPRSLRHRVDRAVDRAVERDRTAERSAFGPMALLLGAQVIINNGDVLLSKVVFTPEDAGLYAAVALVGRAVFFVSWAAVQVVFPAVAAGSAATDRLVDRAALALAGFGAAATAGATLFSGLIADLLFGETYGGAADLLGPYAAATALFSVVNLVVTSDIGQGSLRSAWMMLAGALTQTAVLGLFAGGFASMVWLQVAVMGGLCAAIVLDRLYARGAVRLAISTTPQFVFEGAEGEPTLR